jgi:hypothetical protein
MGAAAAGARPDRRPAALRHHPRPPTGPGAAAPAGPGDHRPPGAQEGDRDPALRGASWTRVTADGKLAFEGTPGSGQRRSFTAKRSLELVLGYRPESA